MEKFESILRAYDSTQIKVGFRVFLPEPKPEPENPIFSGTQPESEP
jgi:hypothetical protein